MNGSNGRDAVGLNLGGTGPTTFDEYGRGCPIATCHTPRPGEWTRRRHAEQALGPVTTDFVAATICVTPCANAPVNGPQQARMLTLSSNDGRTQSN